MKKTIFITTIFALLMSYTLVSAQENATDMKYRRSSLSMILIESDEFPNKQAVMGSWNNYPFPDKYNKHDIELKSIKIGGIQLSDQDLINGGFLKDTLKSTMQILKAELSLKNMRYLNADSSMAVVLPNEKEEYQLKIDKVIKEKQLAKQLVSTWFNRDKQGKFNMNLISERGFYNATEMEATLAKGQELGMSSLGDAGEELIKNTFITFTKLEFYENEPIARAIRDAAKAEVLNSMAGKPQILIDKSLQVIDKAYEKAKEGFSLWSKTWLYRLNWNDSVAAVFYTQLYNNPAAFDNSDLFSLDLVGTQFNQSLVTFKIGETRTQEQLLDLALVRNVDNAFSKLQKENDVFKPKVPVYSVDPIIAQIGMKEGLEGGEKFEVLQRQTNPKTGLTEYKKVGTVTANKKVIWDNRYNAGGKPETEQLDKDGKPITGTMFSGGKSIIPGMLLKQAK